MSILVLDGEQRSSLAVVRSLGRRGERVIVGAQSERSLAGCSRYAAERVVLPSPSDTAHFVQALVDVCAHHDVELVMPLTDASVTAVLSQPESRALPLALPDLEAFARLTNKQMAVRDAERYGIPVPRTVHANDSDELLAAVLHMGPGCVLKPSRSVGMQNGMAQPTQRVAVLESPEDLPKWLEAGWPEGGVLVQEKLEGGGSGVFVLAEQGQIRQWFSHRRIRERPPSGGVSVVSASAPVPDALRDGIAHWVANACWNGVAMFEFKANRDGQPCLMEVNGRFWGSLQLAIDAGVDFPWLLLQQFRGHSLEAPVSYQTGIHERWWLGDLDHHYLQRRRLARSAGQKVWAAFCAVVEWLRASPGGRSEVLRFSDVRPGWFELTRYFRQGVV